MTSQSQLLVELGPYFRGGTKVNSEVNAMSFVVVNKGIFYQMFGILYRLLLHLVLHSLLQSCSVATVLQMARTITFFYNS